jgi:hypothetical protein
MIIRNLLDRPVTYHDGRLGDVILATDTGRGWVRECLVLSWAPSALAIDSWQSMGLATDPTIQVVTPTCRPNRDGLFDRVTLPSEVEPFNLDIPAPGDMGCAGHVVTLRHGRLSFPCHAGGYREILAMLQLDDLADREPGPGCARVLHLGRSRVGSAPGRVSGDHRARKRLERYRLAAEHRRIALARIRAGEDTEQTQRTVEAAERVMRRNAPLLAARDLITG